jgi:hypothetical protein
MQEGIKKVVDDISASMSIDEEPEVYRCVRRVSCVILCGVCGLVCVMWCDVVWCGACDVCHVCHVM